VCQCVSTRTMKRRTGCVMRPWTRRWREPTPRHLGKRKVVLPSPPPRHKIQRSVPWVISRIASKVLLQPRRQALDSRVDLLAPALADQKRAHPVPSTFQAAPNTTCHCRPCGSEYVFFEPLRRTRRGRSLVTATLGHHGGGPAADPPADPPEKLIKRIKRTPHATPRRVRGGVVLLFPSLFADAVDVNGLGLAFRPTHCSLDC